MRAGAYGFEEKWNRKTCAVRAGKERKKIVRKICRANGIMISYEERGEGEPLILIMGLGAPGAKWEPHIRAYEKHFRVIAMDNRGAGQSDKPVAYVYTIREMAEDVVGLMDALEIGSAHINGISMGGAIAQYLAVYYKERVRSVILTNTFPCCHVSFRRSIELLRDACGQLDPVTWGRLGQWIIFSDSFQEEREDFMLESEQADMAYPYPMPNYAYKAQCNGILGHDLREKLPEIQAPVLVAAGDHDKFVPVSVTMEMTRAIPGAQLYMAEKGGHVQHWEQLERYNQVTLDFLLAHREK